MLLAETEGPNLDSKARTGDPTQGKYSEVEKQLLEYVEKTRNADCAVSAKCSSLKQE